MSTQRHLFKPPAATGGLTNRQACALALLQAHPEGLRSIDLGRELHAAMGKPCSCASGKVVSTICRYAYEDGRSAGSGLRRRDLAIKRRSGLWQSLVRPAAPPEEWPADFF